ncbi:MAG: hypothetical protein ABSA14_06560 [Acidimicrobiales bacterium]
MTSKLSVEVSVEAALFVRDHGGQLPVIPRAEAARLRSVLGRNF